MEIRGLGKTVVGLVEGEKERVEVQDTEVEHETTENGMKRRWESREVWQM